MQKVILLLETIKNKLEIKRESEFEQLSNAIDKMGVFDLETVTGHDPKAYKLSLAELKKEINGSKLIIKDLIGFIPDSKDKEEKAAILE